MSLVVKRREQWQNAKGEGRLKENILKGGGNRDSGEGETEDTSKFTQ